MAHQIKPLVNKPDNLSSAFKVHLEVGEDTFTSVPTPLSTRLCFPISSLETELPCRFISFK